MKQSIVLICLVGAKKVNLECLQRFIQVCKEYTKENLKNLILLSSSILANGSFDVVLVKHSWRLQFLHFLHRVANDSQAIEQLSNVERFRAIQVKIYPIINHEKELGNWSCDGELIEGKEITIHAHHQALKLFATGIHLDQIKKINEKESKIIHSSFITKPWFLIVSIFCLTILLYLCYRFFLS